MAGKRTRGKCKYCGTIFNASDYDYVITKMAII